MPRILSEPAREDQPQLPGPTMDPFATLPPEITSEIFSRCLPWSTGDIGDPTTPPLLLTHVCRTWRQIATSTPPLWKFLLVDFRNRVPLHLAEMAEDWMSRAQGQLLSIKLTGTSKGGTFESLLVPFQRHPHNMQELTFRYLRAGDLNLLNTWPLEFTNLRKLTIMLLHDRLWNLQPIRVFNGAPLATVGLIPMSASSLGISWERVNDFAGEHNTITDCMDALHLIPNIVHCDLTLAFDDETDDAPDDILHVNMRNLTLREFEEDCISYLLPRLTLPALETLTLLYWGNIDPGAVDAFLKRSSPSLKKFTLRFFRSFPSLHLWENITDLHVRLPLSLWVSEFFDIFAADPNFLPKLKTLCLTCRENVRAEEATADALVELAGSAIVTRGDLQDGAFRLHSLRIECRISPGTVLEFSEEKLLPYRRLKESGVAVHVGSMEHSVL